MNKKTENDTVDEKKLARLISEILNTEKTEPHLPEDEKTDQDLKDITAIPEKDICLIDNPADREAIMRMKPSMPAATATGHVGDREHTLTRFRKIAALAAAADAVWEPFDEEFVKDLGYPIIKSLPETKKEYLMRPDLGRLLDEEGLNIVRNRLRKNPDVQIVIGEGQSMAALKKGLCELLPALMHGLDAKRIDYGSPVFVKYTRVGIGDLIADEVGAEMACVILGERPGLIDWTGLSCYLTYKARPHIPESKRTVVSNINDGGTPAAEAGAYVADLIERILEKRDSGVNIIF